MENRNERGRGHRVGVRWEGRDRARPLPRSGRSYRAYNPDEDMGGSQWSGASGRGGMRWRAEPGVCDRADSGGGFAGSDFGPEPERYRSAGIVRDYEEEEGERDFGGPEYYRGRVSGGDIDRPRVRHDQGPHYGKGPKGYKRSDARILEDVCEAIADQGLIDATDVEVQVESGVVILTGTVGERHHKRALERLAERTRGVEDVRNELRLHRDRVRGMPGGVPSANR